MYALVNSACIGNIYIKNIYCIRDTCVVDDGAIKYLKIYL